MTINLEWELEDDDGWQTGTEDPAVIAARARRARATRRALTIAALGAMLATGVAAARLDQARRQRRAELEAAISAETLALRIGDREAFMAIQSPDERWRQAQSGEFDAYQDSADQISVTGEILELDMQADRARVVVRESVDGQPYRAIWFYAYDDGWRRIAPDPAAWGDTRITGGPLVRIIYQEADERVADALVEEITDWWLTACRLTNCEVFRRWQVRLDPDPFAPAVRGEGSVTVIRSPTLGRVTDDGHLEPAARRQLIETFAGLWARSMVRSPSQRAGGELSAYSDSVWLEEELTAWLAHEISGGGETSGLFAPLYADYGPQAVAEFVRNMKAGRTVEGSLALSTGVSPAELNIDWRGYLTHLLQAQTAQPQSTSLDSPEARGDRLAEVSLPGWAIPETIRVVSLHEHDGVTWAEVEFQTRPAWKSPPAQMFTYLPFSLIPPTADHGGEWVQPELSIEDWGEMHEERGPRVTLRYYDLDARFAVGLLDSLEAAYDQAINDLALAREYPRVYVAISPFRVGSLYAPGEISPESISFILRSPYTVAMLTEMTAEEYLRDMAARRLALELRYFYAAP